jgi:glutamate-5-semialdehyde dehydrogenase
MSEYAKQEDNVQNIVSELQILGKNAKKAAQILPTVSFDLKNKALYQTATLLRERKEIILEENEKDIQNAQARGISAALIDRLTLTHQRIDDIARSVESIASQDNPVGKILDAWDRPNGLKIERISVPIGVLGIIYESRPNVTIDAAALCLKAGNAVILRGGSESFYSNMILYDCLKEALKIVGLPHESIQMVQTTDRCAVGIMLGQMVDYIDLIIPRGGKSLVKRVQEEARVPVLAHLDGICHTYVDVFAEPSMVKDVVLNAKMRRTGICGATETLLIHRGYPDLIALIELLQEAGCEIRGDITIQAINGKVKPAYEEDWLTEYLDSIISVKIVEDVSEAVEHIERYGSHHTEAIITNNHLTAEYFLNHVTSAIVIHNASTQFADGGEFGMGAEIGIATGKMHARGPIGAEQLTTFKYKVYGNGQIRPL